MKNLVNHPGYQLDDAAADSLARFEKKHGIIPINSAYRTVASQQALIDRWDAGGVKNRPPYLYAPRRPANSGMHVKGLALDTSGDGIGVMHAYGPDFGWFFLYSYDKVHFEYNADRDPSRAPVGRPTLQKGDTGSAVKDLQRILVHNHKAKIAADGVFGKRTVTAVKVAQKRAGITADGIVGPQTWKALL